MLSKVIEKDRNRPTKQHLDALFPRQVFFPQVWPDSASKAGASLMLTPWYHWSLLKQTRWYCWSYWKWKHYMHIYCLVSLPTSFHMSSPALGGWLTASHRLVWDHKPPGNLSHAQVVPDMVTGTISGVWSSAITQSVRNSGARSRAMSPTVQVNHLSSIILFYDFTVHFKKVGLSRWSDL